MFCFGVDDTLKALEMGAVEILIVWENLETTRYVLKNHANDEEKILHLNADQEKDKTHFIDKETGVELELIESLPLLEWFANTDKSQEGSQFCRGFGGIGGILRYRVDFQTLELAADLDDFDLSDDDDY